MVQKIQKIKKNMENTKSMLDGTTGRSCQKDKKKNAQTAIRPHSANLSTPQPPKPADLRPRAPNSAQKTQKETPADLQRPPQRPQSPQKNTKKQTIEAQKKTKTKLATHPSLWPVVWCFSTTRTTSRSYHGCLCCGFDPVFGDKS